MCGRYPEPFDYKDLEKYFTALEDYLGRPLERRYNIAPTQDAPVVRASAHGRELRLLRWGLVPHWAKDASIGSRMINARAETLLEKPAYRVPFERQRCLVPAGGFYEWHKVGSTKQPYLFRRRDHSPIAFAGLWERWHGPNHPKTLETFTIITVAANDLVAPVHERMPLILNPADFDEWLSQGEPNEALLRTPQTPEFEAVPVSSWVNSPTHDDARCLDPIEMQAPQREEDTPPRQNSHA